jgi:uncharacterized protein (TIGR00290 family)
MSTLMFESKGSGADHGDSADPEQRLLTPLSPLTPLSIGTVRPRIRNQTFGASMASERSKVILSWSSGKDCAWALHALRQRDDLEVVGLLTTINQAFDRVAMHAVRRELVEAQAAEAGLPSLSVMLPFPCTNEVYESRMRAAIAEASEAGVTHMAFGDLFLEDVRDYRVRLLAGTGVEPLFPLWGTPDDTPGLARRMLAGGQKAILTCVDPAQLDEAFLGREFDEGLLAELPAGVDSCGERGEFHTFCYSSPAFRTDITVSVGDIVHREGFWFADLCAARGAHPV